MVEFLIGVAVGLAVGFILLWDRKTPNIISIASVIDIREGDDEC